MIYKGDDQTNISETAIPPSKEDIAVPHLKGKVRINQSENSLMFSLVYIAPSNST